MDSSLPALLLLCLLVLGTLTLEAVRKITFRPFDALRMFAACFLVLYLIPALVLILTGFPRDFILASEQPSFLFVLVIATFQATFYLSFFARRRRRLLLNQRSVTPVHNFELKKLSLLLVAVASACIIGYSGLFGGLLNTFELGIEIRGGGVDVHALPGGRYAFLRHLMPLATFGAWIAVACDISERSHSIPSSRAWLTFTAIAFALALIPPLLRAGRADLIYLIIPLLVASPVQRRRWPNVPILIIAGVGLIVWISIGAWFYADLRYGSGTFRATTINEFWEPIASNLALPVASGQTATERVTNTQDFRGLRDLALAFRHLLPSGFFPLEVPASLGTEHTEALRGVQEGSRTSPPGFLAFAYYSLGPIGVALWAALLAVSVERLELWYERLGSRHPLGAVLKVATGIVIFHTLWVGDPTMLVKSLFWFIVGSIAVIYTTRHQGATSFILSK